MKHSTPVNRRKCSKLAERVSSENASFPFVKKDRVSVDDEDDDYVVNGARAEAPAFARFIVTLSAS
jgi:hypothetical protein